MFLLSSFVSVLDLIIRLYSELAVFAALSFPMRWDPSGNVTGLTTLFCDS